jgi:hypothetical protein
MKVAVLLCGQLRTVGMCGPAIRRFFEAYSPDYFMHTWTADTWNTSKPFAETKLQDRFPKATPKERIDEALTIFNPLFHKIEPFKFFEWPVSQAQQYSYMQANRLLADSTKLTGRGYDVVVKCRMDVIWHPDARFNPEPVNENTLYVSLAFNDDYGFPCVTDRWFYGKPSVMNRLGEMFYWTRDHIRGLKHVLSDAEHRRRVHSYVLPEHALRTFCTEQNIDVDVRHAGGPSNEIEVIVRKEAQDLGLDPVKDFLRIKDIQTALWAADKVKPSQ